MPKKDANDQINQILNHLKIPNNIRTCMYVNDEGKIMEKKSCMAFHHPCLPLRSSGIVSYKENNHIIIIY